MKSRKEYKHRIIIKGFPNWKPLKTYLPIMLVLRNYTYEFFKVISIGSVSLVKQPV